MSVPTTRRASARTIGRAVGYLRKLESQRGQIDMDIARTHARVASCLAATREERGLSLRDLAPHAGCSPATLHDIEHCRRWSDRVVAALLRFYGVTP